MRQNIVIGSLLVILASVSCTTDLGWKAGWLPAGTPLTDRLSAQALLNLAAYEAQGHTQANCSLANAAVRREWSTLLPLERKAYTDAVLCLQSKPSLADPAFAPGAKTRYDDFVALHINLTTVIHATANFLTWHRLFTWSYEQELRNVCGYQGYQPYWNWAKTAFDPINSPVFDGSPYSMSGNGIYEPHNCTNAIDSTASPPVNCIPPGEGGGCVVTGPFKNYTVDIAPLDPGLEVPEIQAAVSFLTYDPRCLRRDISVWVSSNWTRDIDVYNLIENNGSDIYWFQTIMQGNFFKDGFYGVHVGGHYTIGGDPGA